MFSKLKSLFLKEKEPQEEEIAIEELPEKLDQREKEALDETLKKAQDIRKRMTGTIRGFDEHFAKLKDAELQNKNIPQRAMQIMEGNREAYIKRTKDFIDGLDLDFDDMESIGYFLKSFQKEIDALNKTNMKSYAILQEFLGNETAKIASQTRQLDSAAKDLQALISPEELTGIGKAKEAYLAWRRESEQKDSLQKDIEAKRKELEELKKKKASTIEKLEELKDSRGYTEYKGLKTNRDEAQANIVRLETELEQKVLAIESGLKKYSRIALEPKIVEELRSSPVRILLDKPDEAARAIEELKKNVEQDKIDMKDRKKQKIMEAAGRLDKSTIYEAIEARKKEKQRKRKLDGLISKSSAMHDFEELDYRLKHLREKIARLEETVHASEENLKKKDLKKRMEGLRDSLSEIGIILKTE